MLTDLTKLSPPEMPKALMQSVDAQNSEVDKRVAEMQKLAGESTATPASNLQADQFAGKTNENAGVPTFGDVASEAAGTGIRYCVAKLKNIPVVGNVCNLVDCVIDVPVLAGNLAVNGFSPKTFKAACDLAAHACGIVNPQIGAGYDEGDVAVRSAMLGHHAVAYMTGSSSWAWADKVAPMAAAGVGLKDAFTGSKTIPMGNFKLMALSAAATGGGNLASAGINRFLLPRLSA